MRAADTSEALRPTGPLGLDAERVAAFGARQLGTSGDQLRMHTQALRGGLESAAVARWVIQRQDGSGPRSLTFVVKRLDGLQQREGAIYAGLLTEDTLSKLPVALPAWPPEVFVGPAQIALPQRGEAALHLDEREAVEVTTRDLTQVWLAYRS